MKLLEDRIRKDGVVKAGERAEGRQLLESPDGRPVFQRNGKRVQTSV